MNEHAVVPGKTLQRPLVHPTTGKVLLPAGTVLTEAYIERLTRQGLETYIAACLEPTGEGGLGGAPGVKDLDAFDIEIPDISELLGDIILQAGAPDPAAAASVVPAAPGAAPVPGAPGFASTGPVPAGMAPAPAAAPGPRYHHNPGHVLTERAVMGAMHTVDVIESQIKAGHVPAYDPIGRVLDEVIQRLAANTQGLHQGMEVRILNQPHHKAHPVNVCILSVVMGLALNYDPEQLRLLAIGALCHDIGKTALPNELLDKQGPLTKHDIELLRQHPLMGKRIMEKLPWASPLIATIVYQHHERNDGSGYPQRLGGAQIHEMSKIVAIAEVYDSLISDTSYRKRFSPEAAYNMIKHGEKQGFDPTVIRAFLRYIVPYSMNAFVMLDSGEVGQVTQINRQNPTRPVLKVGKATVDMGYETGRRIVNSHFQSFG